MHAIYSLYIVKILSLNKKILTKFSQVTVTSFIPHCCHCSLPNLVVSNSDPKTQQIFTYKQLLWSTNATNNY